MHMVYKALENCPIPSTLPPELEPSKVVSAPPPILPGITQLPPATTTKLPAPPTPPAVPDAVMPDLLPNLDENKVSYVKDINSCCVAKRSTKKS